jgi:hypothetical protein
MKNRLALLMFAMVSTCGESTYAAPLPRLASLTIEGTIVQALWSPVETKPGQPGFSGSLGTDRVFPAHFDLELFDYQGVDAVTAARMSDWINHPTPSPENEKPPKTVWVRVNEENARALRQGMRIRVAAYQVTGDEGGTWTHHEKVVVLDALTTKRD